MTFGQTSEGKYDLYNNVSFEVGFTKEDFKVYYNDGKEVKRLRNNKDNKMKYTTLAVVLMYFLFKEWEKYLNGATSRGAMAHGYGASLIGFCASPAQKKNLRIPSKMQ